MQGFNLPTSDSILVLTRRWRKWHKLLPGVYRNWIETRLLRVPVRLCISLLRILWLIRWDYDCVVMVACAYRSTESGSAVSVLRRLFLFLISQNSFSPFGLACRIDLSPRPTWSLSNIFPIIFSLVFVLSLLLLAASIKLNLDQRHVS